MKKKLQLNRTTLRNLNPTEAAAVDGGALTVGTCFCTLFTCNVSCGGTCQNTCFAQVCDPHYTNF